MAPMAYCDRRVNKVWAYFVYIPNKFNAEDVISFNENTRQRSIYKISRKY